MHLLLIALAFTATMCLLIGSIWLRRKEYNDKTKVLDFSKLMANSQKFF